FKDRGSRFLAFAYPVTTEDEIKVHLERLRKEHFGANHHCYAWRLGADKQRFRANDDGEPSGTAGRPILGQLQSFDLTNVAVIVVRYFGGTLLGAGGLVQAYKQSAAEALKAAHIIEQHITEVYSLQFNYDAMNAVMKLLKEFEAEQRAQVFELECSLEFSIRMRDATALCEALQKLEGVKLKWIASR
ncbi:MAG: IMPACT family protein, partial [Bacteroidia bacterium]